MHKPVSHPKCFCIRAHLLGKIAIIEVATETDSSPCPCMCVCLCVSVSALSQKQPRLAPQLSWDDELLTEVEGDNSQACVWDLFYTCCGVCEIIRESTLSRAVATLRFFFPLLRAQKKWERLSHQHTHTHEQARTAPLFAIHIPHSRWSNFSC